MLLEEFDNKKAYLYESVMLTEVRTLRLGESIGHAIMEAELTADQVTQLFQELEAGAAAGGNRTMLGKGVDAAKFVKASYDELKRLAQNTGPVSGFDAAFAKGAQALGQSLGGDQGVMKYINKYREFAKAHPTAQKVIYGSLVIAIGISAAMSGSAAALALKPAIVGIMKATDKLLQGESFSTAAMAGAEVFAAGEIAKNVGGWVKGLTTTGSAAPVDVAASGGSAAGSAVADMPGTERFQMSPAVKAAYNKEMATYPANMQNDIDIQKDAYDKAVANNGGTKANAAGAVAEPEKSSTAKGLEANRDALRAKNALGNEFAKKMGLPDGKHDIELSNGVPVSIDGKPVPANLYTPDQAQAVADGKQLGKDMATANAMAGATGQAADAVSPGNVLQPPVDIKGDPTLSKAYTDLIAKIQNTPDYNVRNLPNDIANRLGLDQRQSPALSLIVQRQGGGSMQGFVDSVKGGGVVTTPADVAPAAAVTGAAPTAGNVLQPPADVASTAAPTTTTPSAPAAQPSVDPDAQPGAPKANPTPLDQSLAKPEVKKAVTSITKALSDEVDSGEIKSKLDLLKRVQYFIDKTGIVDPTDEGAMMNQVTKNLYGQILQNSDYNDAIEASKKAVVTAIKNGGVRSDADILKIASKTMDGMNDYYKQTYALDLKDNALLKSAVSEKILQDVRDLGGIKGVAANPDLAVNEPQPAANPAAKPAAAPAQAAPAPQQPAVRPINAPATAQELPQGVRPITAPPGQVGQIRPIAPSWYGNRVVRESRQYTDMQVQMLFMLAEAGMWDKAKAAIAGSKAAQVIGQNVAKGVQKAAQVGHNLTNKVTADKLQKSWVAAKSPMDSDVIYDLMVQAGVDKSVLDATFQKMNIEQGDSEQFKQLAQQIEKLDPTIKQQLAQFLKQALGPETAMAEEDHHMSQGYHVKNNSVYGKILAKDGVAVLTSYDEAIKLANKFDGTLIKPARNRYMVKVSEAPLRVADENRTKTRSRLQSINI